MSGYFEPFLLTSKANPRYKRLLADLQASGTKRGFTALLGEKLILEWMGAKPGPARERFVPVLWLCLCGHKKLPIERELPLETWELSEHLMRGISDAASPPRLALVMRLAGEPNAPVAGRAVAPWGIQDPGNLGAMLRSAAAFGFQDALLGPGCADPFSPKALRGSMGAAFLLSIRRLTTDHFSEGRWVALDHASDSVPLERVDLSGPLRLMVGNEGHGWRDADMPPNCIRAAISSVGVESLNVAVAVGVACYEVARRQRDAR